MTLRDKLIIKTLNERVSNQGIVIQTLIDLLIDKGVITETELDSLLIETTEEINEHLQNLHEGQEDDSNALDFINWHGTIGEA